MHESDKVRQRPGRKYQDWKMEAKEVPRDDPEGDAYKIRRCLASLIARQIMANLRKTENKETT
jgi:hypothetical protein